MSDRPRSAPIVEAIVDLATGAVAGLVVGIGGARLLRATNRWGWETASGSRIAVLALPVLAYAIGDGLGGNGFVAAYVAGIAAGSIGADLATRSLPLAADTGTVLAAVVWFVFGTIVPRALEGGIDWQVVAYAVLSLTVVRMLPVAISLFGSGLPRRDVLFLGWIGPHRRRVAAAGPE